MCSIHKFILKIWQRWKRVYVYFRKMAAKRKTEVTVPVEESDLLSIRPL